MTSDHHLQPSVYAGERVFTGPDPATATFRFNV
jgi:hypothetical protein